MSGARRWSHLNLLTAWRAQQKCAHLLFELCAQLAFPTFDSGSWLEKIQLGRIMRGHLEITIEAFVGLQSRPTDTPKAGNTRFVELSMRIRH